MYKQTIEQVKESLSSDPIDQVKKAIIIFNKDLAMESLNKAIESKNDPLEIFAALTEIMKIVGYNYEQKNLFLPELLSASDTMQAIVPRLEEEIKKSGKKREILGTVIIGTVLGDLHTIGKQMVGTLLRANGFEVIDLGIDVSAKKFIDQIKKSNADILAMSALLTTTAFEQKNVMEALEKEHLRSKVKVMVGGGAVTKDFADSIGADGYDSTAPGAAKLALNLIGK
jgi:corrinoid protein of di/trimethylamine methyltransferase